MHTLLITWRKSIGIVFALVSLLTISGEAAAQLKAGAAAIDVTPKVFPINMPTIRVPNSWQP